jgi:hypothetical protein
VHLHASSEFTPSPTAQVRVMLHVPCWKVIVYTCFMCAQVCLRQETCRTRSGGRPSLQLALAAWPHLKQSTSCQRMW